MIFTLVVILFFLFWLLALLIFNDFNVPTYSTLNHKKVLVIFPHPDDEVIGAGGLIRKLAKIGAEITVLTLTRGEKGFSNQIYKNNIKEIRTSEARKVKVILGIKNLIEEDFGDENLVFCEHAVKECIEKVIKKCEPTLIITYDKYGLYGHSDHILVSNVVTNLIVCKHKKIKLWYVSFPEKILRRIKIPDHRVDQFNESSLNQKPTHKVFIGLRLIKKIYALSLYRSQRHSFQKAMPINILPFELFYSFQLFEYYIDFSNNV